MIKAVIRTLSDSALYLKETVHSHSPLSERRSVADPNRSWNLSSFLSNSWNSQGPNYSKNLPMEVIALIISFVAASSREDLMRLLLVDKRWVI